MGAKQKGLIEKLKNDISEKNGQLKEYKNCIESQKNTINVQIESIPNLEKKISDISLDVTQQTTFRQKLEKEIEDLQFENKQLRNKVIAFKTFAYQTSIHQTVDREVFDPQQSHCTLSQSHHSQYTQPQNLNMIYSQRPSSANNVIINSIQKDQLLLNGLRNLLNQYSAENNDESQSVMNSITNTDYDGDDDEMVHGAMHRTASHKKISRKKYRFITPKNLRVNKVNSKNKNKQNKKNKKPRPRVSRMTPASYIKQARSTRKRSSSLHQPVAVYKNRVKPNRKIKSVQVKSVKIKKKKSVQSVFKQVPLKRCIHNKHWT